MKLFCFCLLSLVLISCQQETFVLDEDTNESNLTVDGELTGLVLSVTAHDGSFDDILDSSGCFSIQFPYTIIYNGETRVIQSVNDLLGIMPNQDVSIQFPIEITFSNYVDATIRSEIELETAIKSCASNETFLNSIKCVDFIYPITVATFDNDTNQFETIVFSHDQQTFETINTFVVNQSANINFPVSIELADGSVLEIVSSEQLATVILTNGLVCE